MVSYIFWLWWFLCKHSLKHVFLVVNYGFFLLSLIRVVFFLLWKLMMVLYLWCAKCVCLNLTNNSIQMSSRWIKVFFLSMIEEKKTIDKKKTKHHRIQIEWTKFSGIISVKLLKIETVFLSFIVVICCSCFVWSTGAIWNWFIFNVETMKFDKMNSMLA